MTNRGRIALILAVLLVAGGLLWIAIDRASLSAEDRIAAELAANGLPEPLAACMGKELTARLSLGQIAKLERLKPEAGEPDIPLSVAGFLERLRRVDDPQVVEQAGTAAAVCALQHGI